MKAVSTVQKPVNGQLLIEVPERFHDIELEIIILPTPVLHENQEIKKQLESLEMDAHLKGSLPNRPYSKYDFMRKIDGATILLKVNVQMMACSL